jgi:hypothetical protein
MGHEETNRTAQQVSALKMICDGVIDSVKAAGALGAPAGTLYAALMAYGCTLEQFERIMGVLVSIGKLQKRGDLYFAKAEVR